MPFAPAALLALALLPAQNTSPAAPKPPVDPAAVSFTTEIGLLLVAIKPDKIADYESAIVALQEALARDVDPARRAMSKGWRIYKAAETDAKGNVLFVHALVPVAAGADYRPSLLLDVLLNGAPPELLSKYRDAFASAPTKLSLTEFANMAVTPVKKENDR